MKFFNLFRKPAAPLLTPMEEAQVLCDLVNEVIPTLPRNVSFWMDWNVRPPRLIIQERQPGKRVYPQ